MSKSVWVCFDNEELECGSDVYDAVVFVSSNAKKVEEWVLKDEENRCAVEFDIEE